MGIEELIDEIGDEFLEFYYIKYGRDYTIKALETRKRNGGITELEQELLDKLKERVKEG